MRAIGPAGWSDRGFFGLHAKTFGNPTGASSGNGGPTPVAPAFIQVDGGAFPADAIASVVVVSATRIIVVTTGGNAGFSNDAGASWTRVAGPLGLITQARQVLSNAAGTIQVVFGLDSGDVPRVSVSSNGGASWADSTPVGSHIGNAVFYSHAGNRFYVFDTAIQFVWNAVDGATWAAVACPAIIIDQVTQPGSPNDADSATVTVVQGIRNDNHNWTILRTIAGSLFTTAATGGAGGSPAGSVWTGSRFTMSASFADGSAQIWQSLNSSGTSWAQQASSLDASMPPFAGPLVFFGGLFYGGYSDDLQSIGFSPDSAQWGLIAINSPGFEGTGISTPVDGQLYLWGVGGVLRAESDGMTFDRVLNISTGAIADMESGAAGVFAVGQTTAGGGGIWKATS